MKFISIETSVKKQIKASMKRIAQKLIKLNVEKADRLDYVTAFNIWTSRYINTLYGNKYYNLIAVDEELFEDLRTIMENTFLKEIDNLPVKTETSDVKHSKYFIEKPATEKQMYYARYLMNMVKNEPLPKKKYTMYEMSVLINDLKSQMKTI
jgi:hypothetical protein